MQAFNSMTVFSSRHRLSTVCTVGPRYKAPTSLRLARILMKERTIRFNFDRGIATSIFATRDRIDHGKFAKLRLSQFTARCSLSANKQVRTNGSSDSQW